MVDHPGAQSDADARAAWPDTELVRAGTGDCGCPEEEWLFRGVCLWIHLEPDGSVDAFADGGDWGEAEITLAASTLDTARNAAFVWLESIMVGPYQ